MSWLVKLRGNLRPERQQEGQALLDRVKSVADYFGDLAEVADATGLKVVIDSPLASAIGHSLAESLAPVKFVVKLFEHLTAVDDPDTLAYLACTQAYQQACTQVLSRVLGGKVKLDRRAWRRAQSADDYDFALFTLEGAVTSPFARDAEQHLAAFLAVTSLGEPQQREVLQDVRSRFALNLVDLLCHRDTSEQFRPLSERIKLGNEEARSVDALRRHAEYQRALFESEPLLGEPFALRDVYVELDCGVLEWGDVVASRNKNREGGLDPFKDDKDNGGRHPLLEAVLGKLADPEFHDAIVLQGPAGSGKSSFTQRLCCALLDEGLKPIRIELRNLDTSGALPVEDALARAIQLDAAGDLPMHDVFQGLRIFERGISFRGRQICPYVLILDGWDEISLTASRGFLQEIQHVLNRIRQAFLKRSRNLPVRVLLAGRPTEAVLKSGFLESTTALLTLRQQTLQQLAALCHRSCQAITSCPLQREAEWKAPNQARVDVLVKGYDPAKQKLDVLGSPLLAFLALRLLAFWPGDPKLLVDEPTSLYRSLVDLVIGKGGKTRHDPFEPTERRALLAGRELRALLRGTAEAMTVLGTESLKQAELMRYLRRPARDLEAQVGTLQDEHQLSRLLISFFFRADRPEQGCEFAHKSFREYLFAEQVVEVLKDFAKPLKAAEPERPADRLWEDFRPSDPRFALSRRLLKLLGPQWLTFEVAKHLQKLLEWEIQRSTLSQPAAPVIGDSTEDLPITQWVILRDTLADLWDWWGEGVHLRPQPEVDFERVDFKKLETASLIETLSSRGGAGEFQPPASTFAIDGHLGDALSDLAASMHAALARAAGFEGWLGQEISPDLPCRRYQARTAKGLILFAPSGTDGSYFRCYLARINAVGFCPRGEYPGGRDLSGANLSDVDLSSANLSSANLSSANLSDVDLSGANLSNVDLSGANLSGANLSGAVLFDANLSSAYLFSADLSNVDLSGANLSSAYFYGSDFYGANLYDANLDRANLGSVDLSEARNVPPGFAKSVGPRGG